MMMIKFRALIEKKIEPFNNSFLNVHQGPLGLPGRPGDPGEKGDGGKPGLSVSKD